MIKSLYTRIVVIFVSIVMISLLVAWIGSNIIYHDKVQNEIRRILSSNGEKIIDIYQTTDSDNLIAFMNAFNGTARTHLQLFNSDGQALLEDRKLEVKKNLIDKVLAGDVTDNLDGYMTMVPMVGMPVQENGETYALFLTVEQNEVEEEVMGAIHLMYIIILFFGSLLIIIGARYVVQPLVRLTEATKKMAHGNFDIVLPTKRKDEIGELSASFNEMAKELGKLDQMRQEFVANVSHEIQSPLTSISGFSKALKQKQMSEEERLRYLSIIEQESDRLSRLGRNLLHLSHLQHDQLQLKLKTFRLDEQLRNVVISMEPQWSVKDIEIDINLKSILIEADEDQLKQVWTNLITNSIKFTPIQGKITIDALLKNDLVNVSITDTGIGIPKEEQKDIFKPFHKVDRSRDPSIKGNGLGLSIVKQIVDLHHGDITVTEGPDGGAKFIIKLPVQHNK